MTTQTEAEVSVLDQFEEQAHDDPRQAIALMFWKARHANPEMSLQITEADITKFQACTNYLKVTPEVRIYRPRGIPARPGQPAHGERRAIPANPGTPDKPYVVVQLVDEKGDHFVPIENNEEDAKLRDQRREIDRMKDRAPAIAAQIEAELQSGSFTNSTLQDAARTLLAMAKALP